MKRRNAPLALCALGGASALLLAETLAADTNRLPSVDIIGSNEDTFSLSGSAHVLSNEDLEKKEYTDVHRMLRDVPGVYVQEEEGYGLRPNIGIRGTGTNRSDRITVMEDGIPIAPAPYAAPAAYYFPSAGRFHGVEVLKGPDTLRYGPFTVGGALNVLSTPIPTDEAGMVQLEAGEDRHQRGHVWYGASEGQWGFLLETHQQSSDGFKDVDRSNRDTGFDKQDYVAKLRWTSPDTADVKQAVELKLSHSSEVSNHSYLGLTDRDFSDDANRRYGLSAFDQMDNDHDGVALRHHLVLGSDTSLETALYRNKFQRNWFKVASAGGQSIGDLIEDANNGDANAQAILDGDQDVADVRLKNNNREYTSEGIQTELSHGFEWGSVRHDLVAGVRFHQDEVDRYQPIEVFEQQNGSLVRSGYIEPTGGDNRVEEADAFSAWMVDHIRLDQLLLTASLRYEDVDSEAKRYADPGRNVVSQRVDNQVDELMAGLGATWLLDDHWALLAGVHQGFAPPGASAAEGTDPEKSVNYEAGVRYWSGPFSADAIAFFSDYENTVNNCSVAAPCPNGDTIGSQSFGESQVQGLELGLNSRLWQGNGLTAPVRLAYTYTDGEITETADDLSVQDGDVLPYLPENQLSLTLGLERPAQWGAYLTTTYVDEVCVDNTCDRSNGPAFRSTDDYLVVDLAASYYLRSNVEVYAKVDNLFDDQEIVARSPDGARPNSPRTAYMGVRVGF